MKSKLLRMIMWSIAIMCIIASVYFLSGAKNSSEIYRQYSQLSSGVSSNISKAQQFLATYTITTGDDSLAISAGLTKEDIDYIRNPNLGDPDVVGGSPSVGSTGDSVLDASMAVASKFKKTGVPKFKPSGWTNPNTLYYNYSQSGGMYEPAEYGGLSQQSTHRDCSCYCSVMRYFLKMDSRYTHRTSGVFASQLDDVTSQVNTFGDCRVGDVLYRKGHVAMIVKIDDTTVYVGDCGSGLTSDFSSGTLGSSIDKTAEQGYAYTFNVTDSFAGNKKSFTKVLR